VLRGNSDFDAFDASTGSGTAATGTAGTANTWANNFFKKSNPAGLK
jgi:hypothetical protein